MSGPHDESFPKESSAWAKVIRGSNKKAALPILLAALIAIGIGAYLWSTQTFKPKEFTMLFSFDSVAADRLFAYDARAEGGPTYKPLTQIIGDSTFFVKDICAGSEGIRYYLLVEPASGRTNLFRFAQNEFTQISDSDTQKGSLSCDASSGRVVFLADKVGIILLDPSTGQETAIPFSPVYARLLSGGKILALIDEDSVSVAPIGGDSAVKIFEDTQPHHVAVDAGGTRMSVFNPVTSQIDTFSLSSEGQVSYLSSSVRLETQPILIGYMGGEVYGAYRSDRTPGNEFFIQKISDAGEEARSYEPFSPIHLPSRIIASYE